MITANRMMSVLLVTVLFASVTACDDGDGGKNNVPDLTAECTDICEVFVSCGYYGTTSECMGWCQDYYEIRLPEVVAAMVDCTANTTCDDLDQCYDTSEQYCTNDPTYIYEVACQRDFAECEGVMDPSAQQMEDCITDYEEGHSYEKCHTDHYLDQIKDCLETMEDYCSFRYPLEACENDYI